MTREGDIDIMARPGIAAGISPVCLSDSLSRRLFFNTLYSVLANHR